MGALRAQGEAKKTTVIPGLTKSCTVSYLEKINVKSRKFK